MPKLVLNNDYNEKPKFTHSAEARAKMSAAKKGKERSAEHAAKIGAANKGREVSVETRAKLRAARTGSVHSAETRAHMSLAKKGSVHSAETRAKISAMQRAKAPYVYTPRGIFANQWEAAEIYNITAASISKRCKKQTPKWADWYFVEKN
jgi:hypothetical protein